MRCFSGVLRVGGGGKLGGLYKIILKKFITNTIFYVIIKRIIIK